MKKALVVGGSGALGGAIVQELARENWEVTLTSRDRAKAIARAAELGAQHSVLINGLECDVNDPASVRSLAEIVNRWESLDCLVLAAGGNDRNANVGPDSSLADLDLKAARAVMDSNFWSKVELVKALLPALQKSTAPSIVMVGSMSGFTPLTRVGMYSAAMAAVHNFVMWLATEFAEKPAIYRTLIRVNGIAPGFFPAEQNMALLMNPDKTLTDRGASIIAHTPMRRFGVSNEVGPLAAFLADPEKASFITGQVWRVDGGAQSKMI